MININDILDKHAKWLRNENGGERADLSGANLRGADLSGANLRGADLSGADLRGADLRGADLRGADFIRADFIRANLRGANISGANIRGVDLSGAKNIPYIPMACPDEGAYTAYKKVSGNYIVVLTIPADALRSSASGRKCRANKAQVLSIENIDGSIADVSEVHSHYDNNFAYKIGKTVEVDDFDMNRWNECAPGIHHFMNRLEAVDYVL